MLDCTSHNLTSEVYSFAMFMCTCVSASFRQPHGRRLLWRSWRSCHIGWLTSWFGLACWIAYLLCSLSQQPPTQKWYPAWHRTKTCRLFLPICFMVTARWLTNVTLTCVHVCFIHSRLCNLRCPSKGVQLPHQCSPPPPLQKGCILSSRGCQRVCLSHHSCHSADRGCCAGQGPSTTHPVKPAREGLW